MHRFQVEPLRLPEDTGRLVEAWWRIYQERPDWAPPLRRLARKLLDPSTNPYLARARVQAFVAIKDGQPAGTIAAHVDEDWQRCEPGVGFFGLYEFVEDENVARCLLAVASSWLREQGMIYARGPYHLWPGQGSGLLVDGFDCAACVLDPQAMPYYPGMYDRLGLSPLSTWQSWWIPSGPVPERLERLDRMVRQRHPGLEVRSLDMDRFEAEVEEIVELCTQVESRPRLTCTELRDLLVGMRPMVEPRLVWLARHQGEVLAASVALPDLNPLLRRMKGKMFPFGWFHWWLGRSRLDAVRGVSTLVREGHAASGLAAPLLVSTWRTSMELGARGFEVPALPVDDHRDARGLERLGARPHRRYRVFERDLATDATEECPLPEYKH